MKAEKVKPFDWFKKRVDKNMHLAHILLILLRFAVAYPDKSNVDFFFALSMLSLSANTRPILQDLGHLLEKDKDEEVYLFLVNLKLESDVLKVMFPGYYLNGLLPGQVAVLGYHGPIENYAQEKGNFVPDYRYRIPFGITNPFTGDFDGDEAEIHIPTQIRSVFGEDNQF